MLFRRDREKSEEPVDKPRLRARSARLCSLVLAMSITIFGAGWCPAAAQTVVACPGSVQLPPHGSVTFSSSDGSCQVTVISESDQPATVTTYSGEPGASISIGAGSQIVMLPACLINDAVSAPCFGQTGGTYPPAPNTEVFTTVPAPPPPSADCMTAPTMCSTTVTYQPGWNLVSGPPGTVLTGAVGPLYTLQAGDSTYETIPNGTPLQAGVGYWAYFPAATTVTLTPIPSPSLQVPLAQNGYIMAGDPSTQPILDQGGSQLLYAYDPSSGYSLTGSLEPGRGVFVFSWVPGSITIGGTMPSGAQPSP